MALGPTVPRRPVSLRLRLLEKEKEKHPPWLRGVVVGLGQNTGCVLQTANQEQTKTDFLKPGGEEKKKKSHLRVKTHQECLAVTFPPLCRTDAVCQTVMPLCKDQRVFSGCWCWFSSWFILRAVSNSRLMTEVELIRKEAVATYCGLVLVFM
jgi:hypothetical protein